MDYILQPRTQTPNAKKSKSITLFMFDFWNPALRNDSYLLICSSVNCDKISLKNTQKKKKRKKENLHNSIKFQNYND